MFYWLSFVFVSDRSVTTLNVPCHFGLYSLLVIILYIIFLLPLSSRHFSARSGTLHPFPCTRFPCASQFWPVSNFVSLWQPSFTSVISFLQRRNISIYKYCQYWDRNWLRRWRTDYVTTNMRAKSTRIFTIGWTYYVTTSSVDQGHLLVNSISVTD